MLLDEEVPLVGFTADIKEFQEEVIIDRIAVSLAPKGFEIPMSLKAHCGEMRAKAQMPEGDFPVAMLVALDSRNRGQSGGSSGL